MGKKKKRKKDVLKRLAKKRGERSRRRKGISKSKPMIPHLPLAEEELKEALRGSADLIYAEELSDIHFPADELTSYLEEARKREDAEPEEFLIRGVSRLSTPSFLTQAKERLANLRTSAAANDAQKASSSVVVKALDAGISPSSIPFFAALFIRDAKDNPLSDDAAIWKLIYPFIPSRILTPERPTEEKETEYPHIIVPHSTQ